MLSWERLGVADEVDKQLLCHDIYVDDTNFFCGFIKNSYVEGSNKTIKNTDKQINNINNYFDENIDKKDVLNKFCVNVSDCFISLPYLCEVNCTNQEEKCSTWSRGWLNSFYYSISYFHKIY